MTHEFVNTARSLRNKYLVFLGIIIIILITNLPIIHYSYQVNNESATMINISGRQRMLSQRISKLTYNIATQIREDGKAQEHFLDSTIKFCDQFVRAHDALLLGNGDYGITVKPSPAVKQKIESTTTELWGIVNAAKLLAVNQDTATANSSIDTMRKYDIPYLLKMEDVVATQESEYITTRRTTRNLLIILSTASLIIIILSFIVIVLPTIRKLNIANDLLTQTTDRLFMATGAAKIGVWEYDVKNDALIWDDEMYKMYNIHTEDLKGLLKAWFRTIHPEDLSMVVRELRQTLHGKSEINNEFRILWPDGTVRFIRARAVSQRNKNGKVVKLTGINFDVTDQRVSDKIIQEGKQSLLKAQEIAKLGSWDWDIITGKEFWSDEQYRIFGYEPGEVVANYSLFLSALHPDDEERVLKAVADALDGTKPYNINFRIIKKNGDIVYIDALGEVYRDANGAPQRMIGTIHDVTEKTLAQKELRLSDEQFKGAFEYSAIGMALVSLEGKWLRINRQLCTILGYTEDELLKLTFQDITHPDDLDSDLEKLNRLLKGEIDHYNMEKRYLHKNGGIVWVMLIVSLVKDIEGNPAHFVSQIDDITQRKKDEEELLRVNQQLTALFDSGSQVSTISTDLKGTITYFSKGAETLLGYKAEEMVNVNSPAIIHVREEVEKRGDELTELFGREIRGFDVFVEYAKQGKHESREWTYVRKDGGTFPVQLVVTGLRNRQGQLVGFLGIATDITKQKEKEEALNSSLDIIGEQNKRLLNFAHIVSHNLRSHTGNMQMVLGLYDDSETPEEKEEMVDHLKSITLTLAEAIKNLNEVVSIQTNINKQREKLNLKHYIDKTIEVLSGEIELKGAKIVNNVPADVEVDFNAAYMESVLLNFLTNGIKYRHPDRPAIVTLDIIVADGKKVLQIADNGLGIDMKKHGEKLFGMYKTFHGNSDAKGIGLFITKNQVEAMGGKIEVESEVNIGTTFKISLQ
ncbi:MAG: PAS domain-containing protein [Bacteroidetes bacterium]|nr:MAG: PAS domain-containing protein [Bacteroidota bacterium]